MINAHNQTKEEEIGSLPEKEFRIMIYNLENKIELQINSLETRIEKMQEKFNKDLDRHLHRTPRLSEAPWEVP